MSRRFFPVTHTFAANETLSLAISGRVFFVSSVSGKLSVTLGDDTQFLPVVNLMKVGTPTSPQFSQITLQETAGSTASITYYIADGDVDIAQVVAKQRIYEGSTLADGSTTTAGAAATQIVAADANRNSITITNYTQTETAWVGSTGVGNNASPAGVPLTPSIDGVKPGGSVTLATDGPVYVRRGAGNNVTVVYTTIGA